jgi:hypothetical protein
MYNKQNYLWVKTDTPTFFIINAVQQLIDESVAILVGLKAQETEHTKI